MIGVASQWVSTSRSLSHPFMPHTQYSFHFSLTSVHVPSLNA